METIKFLKEEWPEPNFEVGDEPHFLFLISQPYGGSTAIAQILNTCQNSMFLHQRAEGQWLIPGLCKEDRWKENKKINLKSVKAVWLNKYQSIKMHVGEIDVVIEKSPPNMMRIREICSQFKKSSIIACNRDPYANCSSIIKSQFTSFENNYKERENIIVGLTKNWQMRSKKIIELVENLLIPFFTYEDFCQDPSILKKYLKLPRRLERTININSKIKVKSYPIQKISNQNERQISELTKGDIELISLTLAEKPELINFFKYKLRKI